jgi:hypothetical protein
VATTLIQLTDQESVALEMLSRQTGKTQAQLIQEAVAGLLVRTDPLLRRDLHKQGRGIWQDRLDLPDVQRLRAEFDRYESP